MLLCYSSEVNEFTFKFRKVKNIILIRRPFSVIVIVGISLIFCTRHLSVGHAAAASNVGLNEPT